MKGKLILQAITNPVAGMKVIWNNRIFLLQKDLICALDRYPELQQIAIEYFEVGVENEAGDQWGEHKLLSLHPDDWQWAIDHIGEEAEFEEYNPYYNHETSEDDTDYAKIEKASQHKALVEIMENDQKLGLYDMDYSEQESWDDIMSRYSKDVMNIVNQGKNVRDIPKFVDWINNNYHPPKRKL